MRKLFNIGALFLLTLLLSESSLPLVEYFLADSYFYSEFLKREHGKESRTLLSMTVSQFEAIKDEKEFSLNGEYYDIIKAEKSGDLVLVTCYHDKKEGHYQKQFGRQAKDSSNRTGNQHRTISFIAFCGIMQPTTIFSFYDNSRLTNLFSQPIFALLQGHLQQVFLPPDEMKS